MFTFFSWYSFIFYNRLVHMLLDFGAHMEEMDDRSLTPLLCAAKAGKSETTLLLCQRGADFNAVDEKGDTVRVVCLFVGLFVGLLLVSCWFVRSREYRFS